MSISATDAPVFRKLWPSEATRFRDHLLRLDKDSRRLRFAHAVADAFIEDYAARMGDMGGIVIGAFIAGELRAAGELRKLGDTWGREAEAAFSVEPQHQDQGLGGELMGRLIRCARNRGVQLIYMSCLAENARMQALARHHEAVLRMEYGEVVGEIVPDTPDYFSLMAEAVEDRVGYMLAVLDLSQRMTKAA
ncbi:MAG: GNAT family N-acetyltransferase [Hyphomicrobiaceae bacterium]|nr:GNAT family N-acetyltransferase [Hyphomicrobiaceae bacterium]